VKLLFLIDALHCGGAQRVCATLCNHWAERGWDVTLATFDDGAAPPFFPLAPGVRRVPLALTSRSAGFGRSLIDNLRRVVRLRRFVARERPDRILSFIDENNVLALLAAWGSGIPVVVSERTDPAHHALPRSWRILRRATYPWARAIVLQTRAAGAYFPASWAGRIAIVPNPVPGGAALASLGGDTAGRPRRILGLGRLGEEKGFDLLIRAFASVAPSSPEWELTILGDGPQRDALTAQIARHGLGGRVTLPGYARDAMEQLSRADLFVLPSRYEGFPNALCEAMAVGLPVVAFDCPSGPAEIVRDGIDGVLVPAEDERALAAALERLIRDPETRRRLGARAAELPERFSVERIAALWQRILIDGAA
jgi:GalNAc-alpha-(1->4)-GalNAc-alpha-(1->3)-diNAcBac-PP-undecaprenol alpha-1,4-N-acetyl-D-galactosaminyltransferase